MISTEKVVARKDDIDKFIEHDLGRIIQEAFKGFTTQDKVLLEQEFLKSLYFTPWATYLSRN